jgi:hypothetical protein
MQVLYTNFKKPFYQRGKFPVTDANGTALVDPWSQSGNPATPFDHPFYLILNVAVGGTNGWFEDGEAGKPWVDASGYRARKDCKWAISFPIRLCESWLVLTFLLVRPVWDAKDRESAPFPTLCLPKRSPFNAC